MSQLRTTWLCIATEGDTVDGRIIERQDLLDVAELYDYRLYAALIWPEHDHDADPVGEVLEVMLEENERGELQLLAIIRPFVSLLVANANDRWLFTSIEITPDGNFRGTGKHYLEGLAVTNEPASVGTTRLNFSRNKSKDRAMSDKKNWRKKFNIADPAPEPAPEPTPNADVQVLAEALAAAEDKIAELEAKLQTTEQEVTEVQEDIETVKEVVDTEDFAKLRENLPNLVKNFGKLDKVVTQKPNPNPNGNKNARFNFL